MTADPVDSGRAWVIASAAFFMSALTMGTSRSLGIVYIHIIDTFGVTREQASWPFSTYIAVFSLAGPLAGILSHHTSLRSIACLGSLLYASGLAFSYFARTIGALCVTLGAVQGFGLGLALVTRSAVVNQYFKVHRAKANSLASAGGNIGGFAITLLLDRLLEEFDLGEALLIVGGLSLNAFAMSMLFRPILPSRKALEDPQAARASLAEDGGPASGIPLLESEADRRPSADASPLKRSLQLFRTTCKNPMFAVICTTHALYRWILLAYTMFVVDLATDLDVERHRAVHLLPVFSVAELVGRLGCGWIADSRLLTRKNLLVCVFVVMGLCLHVTSLMRSYALLMTTCVGIALASGFLSVLPSVLFAEYLGVDRMPLAFGLATCLAGLLSLTRPPLVGLFRDRIGTYDGLLHAQGFVALGLAGCWLLEPVLVRKRAESVPV